MPSFQGGPMDGMLGYSQEMGDPPAEVLAAPRQPEGEMMGGEGEGAGDKFKTVMRLAREMASSDGDFSEEDKLIIEQVTTLLQKLAAKGEKDVTAALGGRMSPAVGKAYAGAGG